jgi:hypothetical protein
LSLPIASIDQIRTKEQMDAIGQSSTLANDNMIGSQSYKRP